MRYPTPAELTSDAVNWTAQQLRRPHGTVSREQAVEYVTRTYPGAMRGFRDDMAFIRNTRTA